MKNRNVTQLPIMALLVIAATVSNVQVIADAFLALTICSKRSGYSRSTFVFHSKRFTPFSIQRTNVICREGSLASQERINNDDARQNPSQATTTSTKTSSNNRFLPLLSRGLRKTSIAMHRSTSHQVFQSTPSLQRLRQQIQQLTHVAPSSLGENVGLGLFASKNIKAGTVVGLYPAHALGYELVVPLQKNDDKGEDELQDLSMFLAQTEEDKIYFESQPHRNSPYLHATDQPLFQRPSLLSSLFDEEENEMSPPLYLDVNPQRNGELDGAWTSHYINDGASLLDLQHQTSGYSTTNAMISTTVTEEDIEQYYIRSTKTKNCIHIPFGPSPIMATVTTKKVKKGQELLTSYGVVYWLGAVESGGEEESSNMPGMTARIQNQIVESARDLQKAMQGAGMAYRTEMEDLERVFGDLE